MTFFQFLRENIRWLFAGLFLCFLSSFGQTFFMAIFAGEIRAEFGLSHGEWGGIYTLSTAASAVAMLFVGGLTDRFRMRTLGPIVIVALAAACVAMSLGSGVAMLIGIVFVLRFAGQGMASHVALTAMARWFVATRGRALAFATLGFSLGEALLPVGFTALKQVLDWRTLWQIAAGILLLSIPLLTVLLRTERTPQSVALDNAAPGMDARHWSRLQALRQPAFFISVPALATFPAFGTSFWFHQVHFAEMKGWDHLSLVAVFPLGTACFILSILVFGWAADRFGAARIMPFYMLPLAFGFAILASAPSIPVAALGIALMGLSGGGQATLPAACWADLFGTRHLGSIKATVASVFVLGSALGPGVTGWLIDRGVSFTSQLAAYSVIVLFGCAIMVLPLRAAYRRLALPPEVNVVGA